MAEPLAEFWESGKTCDCIGFGYAKNIESKETPNTRVNVIEMDDPYSFVERKNRFYQITLVSRDTRKIVGFYIAFDKSREQIQRLVDRFVKALNTTLTLIRRIQKCAMKALILR